MIDEQAAAEQLARQLVAEIAQYHWGQIDVAANLRLALMDDLLEGREVFRARVVAALYPVFDDVVAAWLAEHGQPVGPGDEVLPALTPARHEPAREAPEATPYDASYLLPRARKAAGERALRASRPLTIALVAFFVLLAVAWTAWELRGR